MIEPEPFLTESGSFVLPQPGRVEEETAQSEISLHDTIQTNISLYDTIQRDISRYNRDQECKDRQEVNEGVWGA